jgi:hypothetical protein
MAVEDIDPAAVKPDDLGQVAVMDADLPARCPNPFQTAQVQAVTFFQQAAAEDGLLTDQFPSLPVLPVLPLLQAAEHSREVVQGQRLDGLLQMPSRRQEPRVGRPPACGLQEKTEENSRADEGHQASLCVVRGCGIPLRFPVYNALFSKGFLAGGHFAPSLVALARKTRAQGLPPAPNPGKPERFRQAAPRNTTPPEIRYASRALRPASTRRRKLCRSSGRSAVSRSIRCRTSR